MEFGLYDERRHKGVTNLAGIAKNPLSAGLPSLRVCAEPLRRIVDGNGLVHNIVFTVLSLPWYEIGRDCAMFVQHALCCQLDYNQTRVQF